MKRMYVLPPFRGQGIGKALTIRLIATAKLLGYDAIRLDTLPNRN
jgi:GNAT superfamily N-acetyltransferase